MISVDLQRMSVPAANSPTYWLAHRVLFPGSMTDLVSIEWIEQAILLLRGHKVMLAHDLARLYGVAAKVLNQAVKRNLERFPADFMFQLQEDEYESLRSQFVTLDIGRGKHRKYMPYAFTEYGVAMLSSVLKSRRAIQVNIEIMRTFGRLRRILAGNKELAQKLQMLEKKCDAQFKIVFDAIQQLMEHHLCRRNVASDSMSRDYYRITFTATTVSLQQLSISRLAQSLRHAIALD